MAEGLEIRSNHRVELRLEIQRVVGLRMGEARGIARRLRIGAQVDHVDEHLGMALCLLAAAPEAEGHQRLSVLDEKSGKKRLERPLAGPDHVGALWIEGE